MTNEERWNTFITELRMYIDEHHLGPSRHTDLYNRCHYFRKKMKAGTLNDAKAKELDEVLSKRDLSLWQRWRKNRRPGV